MKIRDDIPIIYVGETSRSLHERMKEHVGAKKNTKDYNHMFRHHQNEHGGGEEPNFIARVVQYHRCALSRQLEAYLTVKRSLTDAGS